MKLSIEQATELNNALKRIEGGEYDTEKEFFKDSPVKTVKDIERFDSKLNWKTGWIDIDELRVRVVEWIKEDRGLRKDNTIWRINQDELLDLLEETWMKRFNLTKEETGEK